MRALRRFHYKTQQEVAKALHISQAAYSRLEKGEVEISISKLIALSEFYGISLQTLVTNV